MVHIQYSGRKLYIHWLENTIRDCVKLGKRQLPLDPSTWFPVYTQYLSMSPAHRADPQNSLSVHLYGGRLHLRHLAAEKIKA